jgi:protein-disulfide isomerase
MRSLSRSTKISLIATMALLLIATAVTFILVNQRTAERTATLDGGAQVLRENSHRVDTGSADGPVLVEFLDFECESCAAAYPFVEELRDTYAGELTYVIRYFPIPSHHNSITAALAAEAAAQQGQLEPMYQMLFDTQLQWGEKAESQAPLFRTYAETLGLDLDAFDAAIADPATEARVRQDFDEGLELGVDSTPTFFLDDERVDVTSLDEFRSLVDDAVNGE